MQDCKDLSGLQFIEFDFVTDGQEIKTTLFVEFDVFLLLSLLAILFSARPFSQGMAFIL